MKQSTFIVFISSFFLMCCADKEQASVNEFNVSQVKKQIEKENSIYFERFLHNDTSFFNKKYTADACIFPDNSNRTCSMDDIAKYYFNNGVNKNYKISITASNIYGSTNGVIEEGEFNITDINGNSSSKGKFIAIWKNENGVWKIHREIWNSNK